jgi:hypothetical protein
MSQCVLPEFTLNRAATGHIPITERLTQMQISERLIRDANSRKMRAWLVLILALTLLASLAGMQASAQRGHSPVTDDTITDRVRLKLASDPVVKGGALDVSVREGLVTLRGKVGTEKQKSKAEKLAKKVKGVKSVVNEVVIAPQQEHHARRR